MGGNDVLSQDQIDAMLGNSSPAPAGEPGGAAPSSAPFVSAPTATDPSQAEQSQRLESAIERVSRLEKSLAEANGAVHQMQYNFQQMVEQLQSLAGQIQDMAGNLAATPAYGAQRNFTCTSCGTTGEVAVPVTCTHCGQQTWRGWWPQPQQ